MTESEQKFLLNDEATPRDELGRGQLVQALTDVLLDAETPLVVALYGRWGSGKTSIMKQLRDALEERNQTPLSKVKTAWFVPWEHATDRQPAVSLLLAIRRDLRLEKNTEINTALDAIGLAIIDEIKIPYLGISMGGVRANYDKLAHQDIERRSEQARLRERFKDVITTARGGGTGIKLVIFIDDLDRCQPATAVAVLEALKLYLNQEGCIFVLGIDREPIEAAIAHEYESLGIAKETYLDKIVQVPFTIPALDKTWVASYIAKRVPEPLEDCREMLSLAAPDSPRQLKRTINTLRLLDRIAKISFAAYDYRILCAIALIQNTAPDLYQRLRRYPDDWAFVVPAQADTDQNTGRPAWLSEMLEGSETREALSSALAVLRTLLANSTPPADIRPYIRLSDQVAPAPVTRLLEDIPEQLRRNPGQERKIRGLMRQAEEYLQPQPLQESDEKIQKMFEAIDLSEDEVDVMLVLSDVRLRVPAYVMLRKRSRSRNTAQLAECLDPETRFAEETEETRPLFLLLAAIKERSLYLRDASQKELLLLPLRSCLEHLEARNSLDKHGQCKRYCRELIQSLE